MKESRQYLNFLKSYFILFLITGMIGFSLSLWKAAGLKADYQAERMFEFSYTADNEPQMEKQSDEAVAVLRSSQLKEELGLQSSVISVFKPGPVSVVIQVKNQNAETAVNGATKLGGYFLQSYPGKEVGNQIIRTVNPSYGKQLLLGLAAGLAAGLIISLILSYFKNY